MSVARVSLEISGATEECGIEALVEAFWEALRDAGIDGNVAVTSVELVEEER